jgi:hypothetical protein
MPSMVALSEGYSIAPGSWAIPIQALADLKIMLPIALETQAQISVSLVAVDGSVLGEVKSTLVVNPRRRTSVQPLSTPALEAPRAPPPPVPVERSERGEGSSVPPPQPSSEDHERALKLMQKGDEQLAQGLIAPARLLYERAADLGLAQAALALAGTYDPDQLTSGNLRGVSPDIKEAKRWYERARQLGAGEADQRLRRLGAQ